MKKQFERRIDEHGEEYLATDLPGYFLMRLPLLNKSTAFTLEERREFGLEGLLPPHVATLEKQLVRTYANFQRSTSDIEKHVYLRNLQDRNEVLFFALVESHLEEMLPIIYTPTVAEAVRRFSNLYRSARGIVVSTENIDNIDKVLEYATMPDVKLAVATDSEGILGIGDQGYGGIGICIGKLTLYSAAAGIDPATTLPIELDVGTNRADLLDDPLYLGVRHQRLEGQAYYDFIERFVDAFKRRFPGALLQWEDFSKQKAFNVLTRYQQELPSFNDDIQGTGVVVLAGLLATTRKTKRSLLDEVILVHGAGAGGVGVADQVIAGLVSLGASEADARRQVFVIDSRGLLLNDRPDLDDYKRHLARDPADVAGWRTAGGIPTLLETVKNAKVSVLLGLSGQRGAFDQQVVEEVSANTPSPIVFALSNPTDYSEAVPADVFAWSRGRAIVATGSPFPAVEYDGVKHLIGQGNNAFVFPGLGLGTLLAGAQQVTPGMLIAAAEALAAYTDPGSLSAGSVYPRISALRRASKHVATAVLEQSLREGSATREIAGDLADHIGAAMWEPRYLPIRRA